MRPVGLVDQGFLWLERRNQPMHVAGLQLLRPAADDPDFIDRLLATNRDFRELMEHRRKDADERRVASLDSVRERLGQ